ncbi:hypothetical protein ACLESD_17635 [Pyxidicoccus sp. 3LFB2]
MNNDQLYDLYLNILARVRAGVSLKEADLQTVQNKPNGSGREYVDFTGRAAVALAMGVDMGKIGGLYSKADFISQLDHLYGSSGR